MGVRLGNSLQGGSLGIGGAIGQANEYADSLKLGLIKAAIAASGQSKHKAIEHHWTLWDGPEDMQEEEEGLERGGEGVAWGGGRGGEDDATTSLLPPNYGGDNWSAPGHGQLLSGRMKCMLAVLLLLALVCVACYFVL